MPLTARRLPPILGAALLIALAMAWPPPGPAAENTGAAEITLDGGHSGPVPFPHRRHQEALTDCQTCHSLFPQQKESIENMKAKGELERKQVMNTLCTKCHRKLKAEGRKTGPVSCKSCHTRTD